MPNLNKNNEEYKNKKERARQLRNSVGMITSNDINNNNNNVSGNSSNVIFQSDMKYKEKTDRARQLRNAVGMITSKDIEEINIDNVLNENVQEDNAVEQANISNIENSEQQDVSSTETNNIISTERKNGTKSKEEIDEQIQQAQTQTVTANTPRNTNNMPLNTDTKIGLANQNKTQNAQKLTTTEISAMQKANEKNENINKGGIDKFNEFADTVLNNIYGGVKQTAAGLVNVVTSIAGFGIRGLEGSSKIIGLDSTADKLNEIYNNIVNAGSDINETANYESTINSQVKNDLIKTAGNVANVISNMVSSQLVGYATGINGTVVQGLSVGGNSAQEVLNKSKDNIGQATLTGIAKGYTSYLTERMFDANILTRGMKKTSIQEGINRLISNKISSEFGKEFANKTVGIIGENIEELVEDNAGYLIDKLINNEDLPSFQQWWNNTTETARITTLSTFIMGLMGLGGQSFKDIENDMETQYWIEQAEKIIEKENLGIHFNTNEVKDLNTIKDFYITRFTPDGEILNIVPTKGITIENTNQDLNVTPVVVRDNKTSNYNIIDGNTGVMLDSTYYQTRLEAEQAYNEKVNKLSDLQIKDINKKINEANYMITDKIMNIVNQAKEQLQQTSNLSQTNNINYNNSQQPNSNIENSNQDKKSSAFYSDETNYAVNDIKKVTEPFSEKNTYTKNELANIWNDNISDNEYDVIYDSNGDIQSYIAIEEEGKNLVVNQYDNQDNVIKSEIIPENNGKYTSEAVRSTIEKVASIYDENNPINGQVDVEGNEVKDINNNIDNIISTEELSKSVESFKNAKDNIDRQDVLNIANSLNIKLKPGAKLINNTEMSKKAGNNIKPNIVNITDVFKNINDENAKDFRNEAENMALELFRDTEVTIIDTNSITEINKSGIDKTYSGTVTESKIQTADNIKEIIEEGIYNFTSTNPSDENQILFHHFFTPVNYKGENGLIRVVIKEYTKNKTMKDKFYYHQLEYINNKKIEDINSALPRKSGSKNFESISSTIDNSITQKKESVKSNKNTVINKDMQKEKNNTNIQDFGEKIGGARKDLSGQRVITKTNNKEVIHDYSVQNTENGYSVNFKNRILKDGFKSQKEAEQYILDFKENIKSNMAFVEEGTNGDEKRYAIKLRNPRTLKSEYTGKVFTNKLDAESYAIALSIYLKEHGKNLFRPEIQKIERVNPNNKNATKTTGNDILNHFGFKGGEFGNWVNQIERQEFLNYAQNAFTDLAIALDIDESSLGQNNEMNIAFGARGKGLTGAVAHFEPDKHVINMTRLKGAGSLSHEYGHSIDNYLSRIGGYNDSGMVTTNSRNPKLSDNMNKAVNEVINAMNYNVSTNETEIANKNAIYEKNRKDSLQSHMGYLDRIFNGEATTYKYNRKTKQREQVPITVTEKQKQDYQRIKNTLVEGKLEGEVERKLNSSTLKVETIYPEEISTLEKMYKEVIGRKIDEDTLYWLYRYGKPAKQITSVKSESAFSKSAMELDRVTGRKSRYFSKTEEMWARAFEAYVSDKLKAKGITNTYLVHSVNNSEYALFNPFPAGEERKNINKAFDNLIETMKEEGLFTSNTKTVKTSQNNDDIRYMKKSNTNTSNNQKVTDNLGRTLSKQQQEYFKDSKVRDENGNLKTVYHGTDTKFTVFNYDYLGKNGTANGKGFYLADDINVAKSYSDGKNIIEAYVDIQKPLSIGKTTITKNDYIKFLEAVNDKTNGVLFADYGDGEKIQKNSNKYKEIINQFKEEYNYGGDDVDLVLSILNSANITLEDGYRLLKNTIGYDGIIVETNYIDNGDTVSYTQYIPLTPEQIKNVDNTNPTNNKDIRFAKRSAKENNIRKQQTQRNAERSESYIEQEIQKIEKTGNWDDSIPVTKLTDIRRTLENYLGLGIQKGHFRQQAYGIYKTNRDVLRTKELKDMDTILHETGHAMDLGNRIKIDKETIADELLTAISKTGGYENESRQVQLDEGFAEIIREYSIVPDRAKAEYPQTVAVLEGIRQNDKSFDNFITKVQQQTYNYIHQNPRNRTLSNVSIGEQTDKPQLSKEYIKQEVMRNIYDKDYALKVAVNELNKDKNLSASDNAYYLTRLASGIGDKVISMLSDGYIDENGNKLMPGLNRIGEILGNDPERFNDLRAYLVAKRDVDYKAKTLKTGIRTMDSNAVIEQFKNDSQIQETSKLVYDTLDGVLQYVLNNHLIDQETADKIKESNAFYVPMQRVLGDNGNNVGRRGAVADIIKARTGSELDVKDVLENIIANSSNMIQQVENNNILRALYKEGESSGLTGAVYDVIPAPMTKIGTVTLQTWENELKNQGVDTKGLDLNKTIDLFAPNNKVDSKNKITSFIDTNGKRIYLQFYDELLFNSVMNMDKEFMSKVLKISSKLNMPLRYGATMANLGFAIPNMISDTAQATIYSTAGFIPVVDNAIGIIDVLAATNKTAMNFLNKVAPQYAEKINAMYTLYQQTGATSATRMSQYRESTQNLMKDVYGTKDSQTLGIQEKYKPLKRLLDILTYIPELSEQSTRFRVFERNYDYYKNKGTSEMDTRIMAALESRDATQDFGRTGNLTREINQFIPFSAARVGSIYTFAEKVKANPKQVGMRIAILTAIAMAIKAIGYDDDEIEELNQRKKDDNFVLKMGDNIVTIKKPQGILRSMINLAEYIQDLFTGHIEEGKEGKRLGEWINNAIMDNMPADSITGLVPNMVAPLIENAINKDFYYNTDIVKSYDLELPDSEQYYDYNSQLAIWLGNIFNYSPAKIDNLISGYFAGLGTSVTDTMDYFLGKLGITAEQPEMGAEDNAVAKRFIVNVNSNSASIDEMYDRKTELTKKSNSEEGLTTDEKEEFERLTNATSNISKINKQIKEIKKDLTMSGKEKAEQIKLLQQQKTDMARESLKKEVLYEENKEKNASIQFYTTSDSLKKNGYTLAMTSEMKKEYEQIAYEYYSKYESQGLYSKEKLEKIESKAKDYAKTYMFSKYKSNITKSEK